jgi:hypothetical protein
MHPGHSLKCGQFRGVEFRRAVVWGETARDDDDDDVE